MATHGSRPERPMRYSRWLLFGVICLGLVALIIWGVNRQIPTPQMTSPAVTTAGSTSTPSSPRTSSAPHVAPEVLQKTADIVLRAYFDSPPQGGVVTSPDLSRFATPSFIDSIRSQWSGLQPGMSETVKSITYPLAPNWHDDGTVTLDTTVKISSALDDTPIEDDDSTVIVGFVSQNGVWLVDTLTELSGDVDTGDDEP